MFVVNSDGAKQQLDIHFASVKMSQKQLISNIAVWQWFNSADVDQNIL